MIADFRRTDAKPCLRRGGPALWSDEGTEATTGMPVPWVGASPRLLMHSGSGGLHRKCTGKRMGKESEQGGHHGPDESKRIATAGIFEFPGSLK